MKETRKLTDGWLCEFSEPTLEAFPCQSQGSVGDELFEVNFPMHLSI